MAEPLVEIDDGWNFKVLVLDGEWVIRVPRNAEAAAELAKEVALLPALAAALSVAVPRFEQVSREPPFVVYRFIPGDPLEDEDPGGLRAFLEALHSLDVADLPAPRPDWREIYREHAEDWRQIVLPLLDVDERASGRALLRETETLTGFAPALVHRDLGSSHLLCRKGKLVGVIDWADAAIGDPAIDYAPWLNGPFSDWDVDGELRRRALIYHRLVPWHEVAYGMRTEQPAWVRDGLEGVRSRL